MMMMMMMTMYLIYLIGMLHGPYRATTVGASLVNGKTIAK